MSCNFHRLFEERPLAPTVVELIAHLRQSKETLLPQSHSTIVLHANTPPTDDICVIGDVPGVVFSDFSPNPYIENKKLI